MSPGFGLRRRTAVKPAAARLTESAEPNAAAPTEEIEVTPGDAADEAPAGEAPAGEAPAGEAPAGEAPAGEAGLVRLSEYRRAVLSWVAEDAYPVNVAVEIDVKPGEGRSEERRVGKECRSR